MCFFIICQDYLEGIIPYRIILQQYYFTLVTAQGLWASLSLLSVDLFSFFCGLCTGRGRSALETPNTPAFPVRTLNWSGLPPASFSSALHLQADL